MLSKTKRLKQKIKRNNDLLDSLALLSSYYHGETAYIVTCGPSLKQYPEEKLRRFLRNKLVFAVKQAYNILQGNADFHILHHSNAMRYKYDTADTIIVDENEGCDFFQPDILLPKMVSDIYSSVALLGNFNDYLFSRTPVRPCGPGIIYETALYLLVHAGVSRIIIVGWDLFSSKEQLEKLRDGIIGQCHFYDKSQNDDLTHDPAADDGDLLKKFTKFQSGQIINTTRVLPADDIIITALGTQKIKGWLKSHGIDIFVTSNSPNITSSIPVIDLWRSDNRSYMLETVKTGNQSGNFYHIKKIMPDHVDISPIDSRLTSGWYGIEKSSDRYFRWSGPTSESRIVALVTRNHPKKFTLKIGFSIISPEIKILIERFELFCNKKNENDGVWSYEYLLPEITSEEDVEFTVLTLFCSDTFIPNRTIQGSTDTRSLGFRFYGLEIENIP